MQFRSLGQEDPLEEGMGSPLQYSCLEDPMDRGAWQLQSVRLQSRTQRKRLSTHACMQIKQWLKFKQGAQGYKQEGANFFGRDTHFQSQMMHYLLQPESTEGKEP